MVLKIRIEVLILENVQHVQAEFLRALSTASAFQRCRYKSTPLLQGRELAWSKATSTQQARRKLQQQHHMPQQTQRQTRQPHARPNTKSGFWSKKN